ncbi:peptidoglycan-associated lipoprotein Pal [Thaumasiovibrio sp. DFM-14]|uniref:peptidoglycan-associated lipoprotein Pal n=1 Tax=Thaumasiovibrio sp. DFM-14 TaxID=3384792 RepID=UPI00399F86F8
MQLNKILKGLAIALPVMTMAACSSTDTATSAGDADTTTPVEESTGAVVTTPIQDPNAGMTEEEVRNQELRQEQTVYFAFDNSDVEASYAAMLEAHAEYLVKNDSMSVLVEGHADERGTPEYNIALGERRASAVANYLQALGVDASQISIVSYGEEKPLMMGQTEAAYAKNRRAVLVY